MKKIKYCFACEAKDIKKKAVMMVEVAFIKGEKVPLCQECIEELKDEIVESKSEDNGEP